MELKDYRNAGVALIAASFLMIVTMVLHPVGGHFEHLVRIVTIGRVTHIIAILSVPIIAYGFWGLTEKLGATSIVKIAFLYMLFGLVAVMLAAAVNGLILMDFVSRHESASQEVIDSLKPIFRLISGFNHAFDFIFIGAVCISTGMWSYQIIKTRPLPQIIGWAGLLITLAALVSLLAGVVFVDLHGFRIFIFGWVAWVIWIGIVLIKR